MELMTKEIEVKAQEQYPKGSDMSQMVVVMFFVLVALITVFAVVAVQQVRMAQFNAKLSVIEDSVIRIEEKTDTFVGVVERYERALNPPEQQDGRIEVGVGDRKERR